MFELLTESRDWLKKAPMPVILAAILTLGSWIYAIDASMDNTVLAIGNTSARVTVLENQQSRMDGKLDRLLELALELKARQRREAGKESK